MLALISAALSWLVEGSLALVPGWVRTAFANLLVSVIQPMVMPLVEANMFPDFLTRLAIRLQLQGSLDEYVKPTMEEHVEYLMDYVRKLRESTVALATEEANEQHYEIPPQFYELCLGHRRKYSCGYWPEGVNTLNDSEDAAFDLVAARAQLKDGQTILDLGCGWGSFTLWALATYPNVKVTCVSNSKSQGAHIRQQAEAMGAAGRLTAITADANVFDAEHGKFDRVVSIEMLEHVRNYEAIFGRVRNWLKPGGKFFTHTFAHKTTPWTYDEGWMAENFFTNGQMPSEDLFLHFQKDMTVVDRWWMNGRHYGRTCNEWLAKMDSNTAAAKLILASAYGSAPASEAEVTKRLVNWRLFYLACAEMFDYKDGTEWGVIHYLFEKKL